MINDELSLLGQKIARLRIAKNLKQSELAYEAGVSTRTLQRIEAGSTVKSDGLLKVIRQLGRLDELLAAIDTPEFSPYMLAATAGKKPQKLRVRHSEKSDSAISPTPGKNIWPEDQT